MLNRRIALLFLLAAGCRSRSEPPVRREPEPAPGAMARPARPAPSEREVALEGYSSEPRSTRYLAVAFGDDLAIRERRIGDFASTSPRPDQRADPVATFARGELALAQAEPGGRWAVALHDPPSAASRKIDLGALQPTAMHRAGDALYVGVLEGERPRLLWLDLSEPSPAPRELSAPPAGRYKAYDLFARSGSRLLAIDDVVRPIFADWIELDDQGRPGHVEPWQMPSFINGRYGHAALTPDGAGAFYLHAIGSYAIRSGSGHDLARMRVEGRALQASSDALINGGAGGTDRLPVVEEHMPHPDRSQPRPDRESEGRTLVAGKGFTDWTGLAVDPLGGHALVAAGARGLLAFDPSLPKKKAPAVVDVEGECRDVRLLEPGVVLALAGDKERSWLVALRSGPDGLSRLKRHDLPGDYRRFVR